MKNTPQTKVFQIITDRKRYHTLMIDAKILKNCTERDANGLINMWIFGLQKWKLLEEIHQTQQNR